MKPGRAGPSHAITLYRPAGYGWLLLMAIGPSLLYAFLIFGERPGAHLYAGASLVAAGLVFLLWDESRRLARTL
ncbi:MAG TPA: hypothetical protein VGK94_12125 [Candidatus Polarisedimenticolia bacterium]